MVTSPRQGRVANVVTHSRATIFVAALTVVVGVLQVFAPVTEFLQRDSQRVVGGEWWRLATTMLVHSSPAHLIFNLAGIVIVGIAVERWAGPLRWLVIYLLSGAGAGLLMVVVDSGSIDTGASGGVAGLIGAMAIRMAWARELPDWPAWLYSGFFACYLAGLGLGGVTVGGIAGSLSIAALVTIRRAAGGDILRVVVVVVVALAAAALAVAGDVHGFGMLIGAAIGMLMLELRGMMQGVRTAARRENREH